MASTNHQILDLPPPSQKKPVPTSIQTTATTVKDDYPDIPNAESPSSSSPVKEYPNGDVTGHDIKYHANPFDEIIPDPDQVHHRNLVLCFDGTGDQFDADVCVCSLCE